MAMHDTPVNRNIEIFHAQLPSRHTVDGSIGKTVTCMVRQEQQNQLWKHFHVDSWKHSDDNSTTMTKSTRNTAQYLDNNPHILYHTNWKY